MRKIANIGLLLVVFAVIGSQCFAEEPVPLKFYRLDFAVKELDAGKVVNSRSYWTAVATTTEPSCRIRTNSQVPVPTTADGSQFQNLQLGVSIDCGRVMDHETAVSLRVGAEIKSIIQEPAPTNAATRQPIIRENRWDSTVVVPLKKPTVIFSSDDLTTKHQMQLELTATPIP